VRAARGLRIATHRQLFGSVKRLAPGGAVEKNDLRLCTVPFCGRIVRRSACALAKQEIPRCLPHTSGLPAWVPAHCLAAAGPVGCAVTAGTRHDGGVTGLAVSHARAFDHCTTLSRQRNVRTAARIKGAKGNDPSGNTGARARTCEADTPRGCCSRKSTACSACPGQAACSGNCDVSSMRGMQHNRISDRWARRHQLRRSSRTSRNRCQLPSRLLHLRPRRSSRRSRSRCQLPSRLLHLRPSEQPHLRLQHRLFLPKR